MRVRPYSSTAIALTGTAAAVLLLYFFRPVLWPLAAAMVLAVLVQAFIGLVLRVCPWASRRVVLVFSGMGVLGLMALAGAVIYPGVLQLVGDLPLVQRRLDTILFDLSARFELDQPMTLQMLLGGFDIRATAGRALLSIRDAASGFVLTALFLIFLLFSWNTIQRRIVLAAGGRHTHTTQVLERSIRAVESYLWIQTLSGIINGSLAAAVMFAVGLEHWHFWALALFLLAYIPFVGVAVGSTGPALFALLQFPSPAPALMIFLSIQVVAFLVGNLLVPRLEATTQNLDPCAGLLAVGGWTLVWGLPGAFLAIPLTLALIYHFAGTPRMSWLAILLSHDGDPFAEPLPEETTPVQRAGASDP